MRSEYDVTLNETTSDNLIAIAREQSMLEEARICELHELSADIIERAYSIFGTEIEIFDVLSLFSELELDFDIENQTDVLENNIERLSEYRRQLSLFDKAVLCELILEILKQKGRNITESDFLKQKHRDETFVYVKNPFADEAYDVFSESFTNPRVEYAKDFRQALQRISDGDVSYCLLPLEDKGGSRIHSVAQLIFDGDFKINSVIPVFGFDGLADMKYALVSKYFTVPHKNKEDDRYLEIRIPKDTDTPLSEILLAAQLYNHGIYRIGTVEFDTEEGARRFYSIVFRDDGRDFTNLLTFLTLFTSSYSPIGVYKNLE